MSFHYLFILQMNLKNTQAENLWSVVRIIHGPKIHFTFRDSTNVPFYIDLFFTLFFLLVRYFYNLGLIFMVTTSITESVLSLILSQIVCNLRLICTLTVFLTESILSSIMYDVNFSWQPSVKLNPSSCNFVFNSLWFNVNFHNDCILNWIHPVFNHVE